jgi:hypothetical protein
VAQPRPPPPAHRRPSRDVLGELLAQQSSLFAPAHQPEPGRVPVPQPLGEASGYDPGAAYAGARGSTREAPRDTSFGHSTGLIDWIAARMGWR